MSFPPLPVLLRPVLLAVIGLPVMLVGCGDKAAAPAPPPPEVRVLTLALQPASVSTEYVGQTEAHNSVEIRPRVGGLLEQQVVVEGSRVKKGEVLFRIDPQPFLAARSEARAARAQAEAAMQQAERDYQRIEPLMKLDAVSQQEFDAAVARRAAARASVEAANAALRTADLNLDYTTVTSPIDGIVDRAQIRVGGLVTAYSTLLTTVYDTETMYVNISITEQRMLELNRRFGITREKPDRTRDFMLRLTDGSTYPHPAHINMVNAAVDPATGTLPVRLEVANPLRELLAGQFVRVLVAGEPKPDALLVPQRAVLETQGKNYVWVVDAEDKVQKRDVVTGARIGSDWLIEQGLAAGERVIVEGVQRARPGAVVAPQPWIATPAPAPAAAAAAKG